MRTPHQGKSKEPNVYIITEKDVTNAPKVYLTKPQTNQRDTPHSNIARSAKTPTATNGRSNPHLEDADEGTRNEQCFTNPNYDKAEPTRIPPINSSINCSAQPHQAPGDIELRPDILCTVQGYDPKDVPPGLKGGPSPTHSSRTTNIPAPVHPADINFTKQHRGTSNQAFEFSDSDSESREESLSRERMGKNEVKQQTDVASSTVAPSKTSGGFHGGLSGEDLYLSRNSGHSMESDDPDGVF